MAVKDTDKTITRKAQDLQRALQADLALAKRMLCVLNAETEALLVNDARSVAMMERHCRELVAEQTERDGARKEVVEALSGLFQIESKDGEPTRLADLALRLPMAEAKAVVVLRREILATHEHIRRANERNKVLLENALSCIESTLDTIREFAFKPAAYGINPNRLGPATVCLNQTA